MHSLNPPLIIPHFVNRRHEILFNKFRGGFTSLADDLVRHNYNVSHLCECGVRENYFHYFFVCQRYVEMRIDLISEITPLLNRPLDLVKRNKGNAVDCLIFGSDYLLNPLNPQPIFDATINYIIKTKRFS